MDRYVCIDVGGTALKYGLANERGRFLERSMVPTEVLEKGASVIVDKVSAIVRGYQQRFPLAGVAISTAGMVDPEDGHIIYAMGHFPGYTGLELQRLVSEAVGLPCAVENDVNCVGLGEMWLGAGCGVRSLFCATVGTGIGGRVILNGQLVHGASYGAGEVGYLRISDTGTFEELASTKRLVREVARRKGLSPEAVDGKLVFAWAGVGDAVAEEAIERMVGYLAVGLANVCYVLNPEVIVLGGGIMAQQEYLRPRIQAAFEKAVVPNIAAHTSIRFAKLGNDAGMAGALYNLLHRQGVL